MKILYACRLFTGLERCLLMGRWVPTGVPTIYRIIEALDRGKATLRFVMTCKEAGKNTYTSWKERRDVEVSLTGLQYPVLVLSGTTRFSPWKGKWKNYYRELRQAFRLMSEMYRFGPDILYFDHANVWTAGLAARLQKRPVVLRVMGAYPAMLLALEDPGPVNRILRWLYRAPYALVIGTQDGSRIEEWMERALNPAVKKTVLLNGVDLEKRTNGPDPRLAEIPTDRTVVLFLGKLEIYKGCDDFVDALLLLRRSLKNRIHGLVIGIGNRLKPLLEKVDQAGAADMFTFIDRIPHDQVVEAHVRSDIYVSLNRFGNMSNANLEAMMAGACMIILEPDPNHGYDVLIDDLFPPDLVWRVSRENVVVDVAGAIECLTNQREERIRRGRAIADTAANFIPTWEERIDREIVMLKELVAKTYYKQRVRAGLSLKH